jgi:hypothetical protein
MFESIISMGILSKKLIMNDLERYQNYQFIEIYKTYSHIKKLGLEILSGVSKDQADIMEQKRNEYMHKFGTKLPTWTGKTLAENVRLVDADYPPTCNEDHFYEYLYCQVYRKGSQVTHASFAGLSKGVEVEAIKSSGPITLCRFEVSEPHLIFSCFHSLIIFLSSVRFLGYLLNKKETEDYFQEKCKYVIS